MSKTNLQLFILSCLILFTELALIRWIPSNIRFAGYFSNFILLASLLGVGLGMLLTNSKRNLFLLFSPILLLLLLFVTIIRTEISINTDGIIFFKDFYVASVLIPAEILIPSLFVLTVLVFLGPGQLLGKLLIIGKPLKAYIVDLLGGIVGIILFSLISYISTPAYGWFIGIGIATIVLILLLKHNNKIISLQIVILLIAIAIPLIYNGNSIWSPYNRLTIIKSLKDYHISANLIAHQYISDYRKREQFYYTPYNIVEKPDYKSILIIGAGSGSDVATALGLVPNVEVIDAVEIDPQIARIGKLLHPNKPYDNSKVNLIINDGRNVLETSQKKYDLIIFALPDSIANNSYTSNIRLESFLFTKEAFQKAKERLSPTGMLVLYNFYREPWLVDKIYYTLSSVFKSDVKVVQLGGSAHATIFLAGQKTETISEEQVPPYYPTEPRIPIASDNWPFIYLKNTWLPSLYVNLLLIIGVISTLSVFYFLKKDNKMTIQLPFFFLGAGFFLLQTKNLVTFSFLFGNTWFVNAFVIGGIMTMLLIAAVINLKFKKIPLKLLYTLLFLTLILNLIIPSNYLQDFEVIIRFIIAVLLYGSPIFIASLIFSSLFKNTKSAQISFASNILGIVMGGILEYTALIYGYQFLFLIAIILYSCSLIHIKKLLQ